MAAFYNSMKESRSTWNDLWSRGAVWPGRWLINSGG